MYGFDPIYFIFAIPGMLLGMWAQNKVKGTFNKFAKVRTSQNITGEQVARRLLDAYGLRNVNVERVSGTLTDHYDPRSKTLRLSDVVYDSPSVAAAGVAAHEMGHALQDAEGYSMLRLRGAMVPAIKASSMLGPMMMMGGLFAAQMIGGTIGTIIMLVGIAVFSLSAIFALVTLPVEFDASKRAKKLLMSEGMMAADELKGVDKVLDAAAWTYIAAAIQAVMTVLYYVMRMQRNRR